MEILLFIYSIVIGMLLGSFIALAVLRLPKGESIVRPRSHCTSCGHTLAFYQNIPIVSFIILRGRCAYCQQKIAWFYPFIEIISTVFIVLTYLYVQPLQRFFLYTFLFMTPMLILTFTDWRDLILPNVITLPGIIFGFIVHAVDGMYFSTGSSLSHLLIESAVGAVAGALPLFLIAYFYMSWRGKEGLGMGDVKLAAMIGAFFGWKEMYFILLLASLTGAIYGVALILAKKNTRETPLPLGSFLTLSSIAFLFWGKTMLSFYLGLFQIL